MYDYVIEKPELNEETLAHYGVKGMKWRKHKTPRQRMRESKRLERLTKFQRELNNIDETTTSKDYGSTPTSGSARGMNWAEGLFVYGTDKKIKNELYKRRKKQLGTANSLTGGEGSNIKSGLKAGKKRANKKK